MIQRRIPGPGRRACRRHEALAAVEAVGGRIYAIGGGFPPVGSLTVEEYDPATDTWTTKTDMPTARLSLCSGVVNGNIHAIGGAEVVGVLSAVEEYDPATGSVLKTLPKS
jgi:hypothetical protein